MPITSFWSPLDRDCEELRFVRRFEEDLEHAAAALDDDAASRTDALLRGAMGRCVRDIVSRDSLPHLSHVVNGWGLGLLESQPLLSWYGSFVQEGAGRLAVRQCHPEGDYHPWQSFAYATMAGADAATSIPGTSLTLGELALNCTRLATADGVELGHLLFTLAHLNAEPNFRVEMLNRTLTVEEIVEECILAHHLGSFRICRKFHLTEGLCAAVALLPGAGDYREVATGYLLGQLWCAIPFALITAIARRSGEGRREEADQFQWKLLHDALVIAPIRENHYYFAGHLMELAGLAWRQGFEIPASVRVALAMVANDLNALLDQNLLRVHFADAHLHFGHYRRGLTLLPDVLDRRVGSDLAPLDGYRADFDGDPPGPGVEAVGDDATLYEDSPPPQFGRRDFLDAVAAYNDRARGGFGLRGGYPHFRRVLPPGWPRAAHYELLDYGSAIGVEIHLENSRVAPAMTTLVGLSDEVAAAVALPVEIDRSWYGGRGRIRVVLPGRTDAAEVADHFDTLIRTTHAELDSALRP